jgi:glycosyltransferase involved in cell wall biosynthesis
MVHNRYGATARGGAERVVERLVAELERRGHAVVVVSPSTPGFASLGRMPALLRACWHVLDMVNVRAAAVLRRAIIAHRPDVIHTHNLVGCGGLTPRVIRERGILWAHTLHDAQLITPSGILIQGAPQSVMERSFVGRWFRAWRKWVFASPAMVIAPSRWLLDLHRRYGFFARSAVAVIGNPIDVRSDALHPRSGAIRRFVFVGQVEGVKGIEVLVEAFRRVRSACPDATLQIVGDGSRSAALRRSARDVRGISLRGRLDGDGVRTAIAESDVLVVPSLVAENQPSVILEAFAVGVPVVASRIGGIPELVRDGETGFLVHPGSVDDLARVLQLCAEDPPRLHAMRAACHAVAGEHAIERIVAEYEEAYRSRNGSI